MALSVRSWHSIRLMVHGQEGPARPLGPEGAPPAPGPGSQGVRSELNNNRLMTWLGFAVSCHGLDMAGPWTSGESMATTAMIMMVIIIIYPKDREQVRHCNTITQWKDEAIHTFEYFEQKDAHVYSSISVDAHPSRYLLTREALLRMCTDIRMFILRLPCAMIPIDFCVSQEVGWCRRGNRNVLGWGDSFHRK